MIIIFVQSYIMDLRIPNLYKKVFIPIYSTQGWEPNRYHHFWSVGLGVIVKRGARGIMVIVLGSGHGDTSSNPGRDRLHFTKH